MVRKPELGPALLAPTGRHLSPVRKKVLVLLNEHGPEGVMVALIAQQLGGHPNRARAHLDGLVADGLASSSADRPNGRGRPALRYWISPSGRTLLDGATDADNQSLTRAFAEYLATTDHPEIAYEVGKLWASSVPIANDEKSGTNITAKLTALLATAGFNPAIEPDGQTIRLRTCPFVGQARTDHGEICGIHGSLIEGALDAWQFHGTAQLLPFSVLGACTVKIEKPTSHEVSD